MIEPTAEEICKFCIENEITPQAFEQCTKYMCEEAKERYEQKLKGLQQEWSNNATT